MKLKKSLINTVVIGSIFFVFSLSYGGIISLQDSSLNKFWEVKKLNSSAIKNTYADDDDDNEYDDDDYRVVKKVNVISPVTDKPVSASSNPVVNNIVLSNSEKIKVKIVFNNFFNKINKITNSDSRKLQLYKRLNELLDEKILTLELIKSKIKDTAILEKYEKKILLFNEVNGFVQEKILVYIDSIDLASENSKITVADNTNTTSSNTASNNSTVVDANAAANAVAAKTAAANAAAANAVAAKTAAANAAAAKTAAAKLAAAKTAAANAAAAKLAAEKAAAAKLAAAKAAAAKAAAASVNTTTTAS